MRTGSWILCREWTCSHGLMYNVRLRPSDSSNTRRRHSPSRDHHLLSTNGRLLGGGPFEFQPTLFSETRSPCRRVFRPRKLGLLHRFAAVRRNSTTRQRCWKAGDKSTAEPSANWTVMGSERWWPTRASFREGDDHCHFSVCHAPLAGIWLGRSLQCSSHWGWTWNTAVKTVHMQNTLSECTWSDCTPCF